MLCPDGGCEAVAFEMVRGFGDRPVKDEFGEIVEHDRLVPLLYPNSFLLYNRNLAHLIAMNAQKMQQVMPLHAGTEIEKNTRNAIPKDLERPPIAPNMHPPRSFVVSDYALPE